MQKRAVWHLKILILTHDAVRQETQRLVQLIILIQSARFERPLYD